MTAARYLRRGRLRAWVAPGVDLEHAIAGDGDPDHLLTRPDCRIVKLQRKVVVGRVETAAGALWVKRYAVFAWRVALASLWRASPAFGAWAGAGALAAHGFATPEPIAAIEFRRAGLLRRSFFVTREVAGAVTADMRWQAILADPDAPRRRAAQKDRRRGPAPAPGGGPTITCTVVCQDEEAHMVPCLESVAWCDEIVVVDGGSRDRTPALARRFTDRVLVNPWPGYRAQKQFALDAARGEWVLNLDADERVSPELVDEIRAALPAAPPGVAGFAIPRLVCYLGRWWFRGDWYPRRVVRLVRRAATRWGGTDPHERAEVSGRVVWLRQPLLHHSYADISDHLRSLNKLTAVAAAQPGLPRRVGPWRLVGEPAWRFVRAYLLRGGGLEAFPGLFVAATGAFSGFLRWAEVRERRAREEAGAA